MSLFQFLDNGENAGGVFFNNWAFDCICAKVAEEAEKKGLLEIANWARQAPSLGFYALSVDSKAAVILLKDAIVTAQQEPLVYGELRNICEAYPERSEYEEGFFCQQAPILEKMIHEILEKN